jgi:phosphatidylglycerol---prolipoprotein diacylglyceryl transferase
VHRILFRRGPITIHSYPAMLYLGLVLGIFAQEYAARLRHLDSARVLLATFLLLIAAFAGARLLHVILHWRVYRSEPRRVWRRSEGGAALYGGYLLIVPLSVPILHVFEINFGAYWDTATFCMLIGLGVGRIGCLLNGCCGGRPSASWLALNLSDHRGVYRRRIPTQILESAWAFVVLAGAVMLWQRVAIPGAVFLYGSGAYGVGRFFLEATREHQDRVGPVALNRALSLAIVAVSIIVFTIIEIGPQ